MLTKADDFPIHQRPEPIATAGSNRNFYDRYFFNGYTLDGHTFFAAALGVYPHLNVMDAAFCVVRNGVQHNLRASRLLNMERMDTTVGPISVHVVDPLKTLRVHVASNPHGIAADIVFHARARPVEEPRFTYRQGPRTVMDYTRLTQNGCYGGHLEVRGETIEIDEQMVFGTRDRSWGIRPVGAPDPQPAAPPRMPQFYWLWSPLNFTDRFVLYHVCADAVGTPWNTQAVTGELGEAAAHHFTQCRSHLNFKSGTRHALSAVIDFGTADAAWRAELNPRWNFYMSGLGYMHPEWGHGLYKGENVLGYDTYDLSQVDENDLKYLHVQSFVTARLAGPGDMARVGAGVLEQLIIGPHAPSGFKDVLDPAP